MSAASQPRGTRDGTAGMKGRYVWIARCQSERCGHAFGAFTTKAKAQRRKRRMEVEDGCLVKLEQWKCH